MLEFCAKKRLFTMNIRRLVAQGSFAVLLTMAAFGKDEVLEWKKAGENTAESAMSKQGKKESRPPLSVVRKKPDGTNEIIQRDPQPGAMKGSAVYSAELSPGVRKESNFVGFLLSGTAGVEPDNGTIICIDGATLGFKRAVVGNRVRAQVYALTVGEDNTTTWKSVNWGLPIDPSTDLTAPTKMMVRLDHVKNTWALYHSDVLIADGLPLLPAKGPPTFSLRPGVVDSDTVKFMRAWSASKPDPRQDKFLPAEADGKIDYEKAQRESDSRL